MIAHTVSRNLRIKRSVVTVNQCVVFVSGGKRVTLPLMENRSCRYFASGRANRGFDWGDLKDFINQVFACATEGITLI
jgi:hypothetical protein